MRADANLVDEVRREVWNEARRQGDTAGAGRCGVRVAADVGRESDRGVSLRAARGARYTRSALARLVVIGSRAGKTGGKRHAAAYGASKAGVMVMSKALASEYAEFGITTNVVAPALIDTQTSAGFARPHVDDPGRPGCGRWRRSLRSSCSSARGRRASSPARSSMPRRIPDRLTGSRPPLRRSHLFRFAAGRREDAPYRRRKA